MKKTMKNIVWGISAMMTLVMAGYIGYMLVSIAHLVLIGYGRDLSRNPVDWIIILGIIVCTTASALKVDEYYNKNIRKTHEGER